MLCPPPAAQAELYIVTLAMNYFISVALALKRLETPVLEYFM